MENTKVKVGIFVTFSFLAFATVVLFFGELPFLKGNTKIYYAYFTNVAGLSKGAYVRVAGVKAGKVEDILFERSKIKVVLSVADNVPIYKDAEAKIESLGLLGDKYVEIEPGHPSKGLLPPNSVIAKTAPPADTSTLIAKLNQTTENINKLTKLVYLTLEENRTQLRLLIANLSQLSANLNQLLEENKTNINQTLASIREITAQLEKTLPQLSKEYEMLAKNLNGLIKDTRPQIKETLENIAALSRTLNEELPKLVRSIQEASDTIAHSKTELKTSLKNLAKITEKIERGEGTLGKLINDQRLYRELTKSVKTLGKAASVLAKTDLHIEAWAQYEGTGDSKAGVNIMLQPDSHKYYLLGIVGDSAGKVTKKVIYENGQPVEITEKEYKPEINLQYARIFADRWLHPGSSIVLRVGIKESTGGVGLDYVYNDRLMFTSDIWDFGREDHPGESLKPNTEVGFKYMLFNSFFVKAGGYDLLNPQYRTIYIGGGMSFTDNDLKYLLGGMSLSSF